MKRLLIVLLLSVVPALAGDNPLSGSWKVVGDVAGYPINRVCTFKQDGTKLTGSCQQSDAKADDKVLPLTGEVKDKTITWKYDVEANGSTLTASYTGAWDGDATVAGAIDVQPMNVAGKFTATKNK
jgi:hypothetical protein